MKKRRVSTQRRGAQFSSRCQFTLEILNQGLTLFIRGFGTDFETPFQARLSLPLFFGHGSGSQFRIAREIGSRARLDRAFSALPASEARVSVLTVGYGFWIAHGFGSADPLWIADECRWIAERRARLGAGR